ncbi:protein-L-isoaspartate O-methyltransferase family protein [Wenzhouxiangella limi]|uniref:Protein-L-isoaspartate O-methyltransferase n=1 Tax=Wenzhouxiangella limi TaxID=2707351 RepID=A0A845V497_9GAMM|nr:protein-L-isoaspartate O-methyltransferase [Wenzhouxiangella limi]NDY96016.1 protein-L-isoaspartate O-methyltransferase [Wenzhouxiangella limi]
MSLNIEQARFNMVEQQIRTWDVLDTNVLDVLGKVPREDFVPSRYRRMAFADLRLPLAMQQVMMKPVEEGRMLQALGLEQGHTVLEIGTGSGFTAACLSALGGRVLSIDIHAELADTAAARLERLGFTDVEVRCSDVFDESFDPGRTFDRIVVTGSAADVPTRLLDWVSPGGCLFAVRGCSPAMEAVCVNLDAQGQRSTESLFETDLPRLIGAEDRPVFEF